MAHPKEEALGTTVSLVQALGLGLKSAPPDTLVVIYAERDTQFWAEVLHQACRFFLQCEAHLGYRLQLIPVAAILCYAPSSTV